MTEINKLVKKGLNEMQEISISLAEKWVHGPFLAWVSCEFFQKHTLRRDSHEWKW